VLFCVLCLIVVPLPPGTKPFAVKINNIYIYIYKTKCALMTGTVGMRSNTLSDLENNITANRKKHEQNDRLTQD
jgi:hypothetical protein